MPQIEVINQSTVLTYTHEVEQVVAALQKQVDEDFAPEWYGASATLILLAPQDKPNPAAWQLVLLDDADQADALGYHELTADGLPLGKVFVKTTMADELNWTITASHELLEMLGDPDINLCAEFSTDNGSRFYAYEVCDACEDDSFGYGIDDVMVSNFVLPEWFMQNVKRDKYDFRGHIDASFKLLTGGYIGEYINGAWTQVDADLDQHKSNVLAVHTPHVAMGSHPTRPNTRSTGRLAKRNSRKLWRPSKI